MRHDLNDDWKAKGRSSKSTVPKLCTRVQYRAHRRVDICLEKSNRHIGCLYEPVYGGCNGKSPQNADYPLAMTPFGQRRYPESGIKRQDSTTQSEQAKEEEQCREAAEARGNLPLYVYRSQWKSEGYLQFSCRKKVLPHKYWKFGECCATSRQFTYPHCWDEWPPPTTIRHPSGIKDSLAAHPLLLLKLVEHKFILRIFIFSTAQLKEVNDCLAQGAQGQGKVT